MARVLRKLAENRALARVLALVERLDTNTKDVLRVVTYRRVGHAEPFERQIEHIAGNYAVVSIPRVLETIDGGRPLPPRALLLSFDDAHRTFANVAWPILSRHELASVLFVPTASTRSICADLQVPEELDDVLDWNELRALSRAGVSLGAHARTHPRLDCVSFDEARAEITGSLVDLEREIPGLPRLFAYPDGRLSDELVGVVRGAGVELAFTTRTGTNDMRRADRLRLRRIFVDAGDSLDVLRAKLAMNSPHWSSVQRILDPPSADERSCERAARADLRRVRFVHRFHDALLNGAVSERQPLRDSLRALTRRRSSIFERVRNLGSVAARSPALGRRLRAALLDTSRLPFPTSGVQIIGYGSGVTVFRLEALALARPHVLKVYRRTIGRPLRTLLAIARRHRATHRRLCAAFGAAVMPARFVVLHGPLRGLACVGALQELIPRALDPLTLEEGELLGLLRGRPELGKEFVAFAENALELRQQGFFPDLFGPGNLLVLDPEGAPRLRLIDYWLYDMRLGSSRDKEGVVNAMARRFESLLREARKQFCATRQCGSKEE